MLDVITVKFARPCKFVSRDTVSGAQEQEQDTAEKQIEGETYLREQDRFLPIANVSRIMKKAVPPIGKVC